MRKSLKTILCVMAMGTLFLVGCNDGVNGKEVESNKETEITTTDSTKQAYLEKLDKLEADLKESLKEKYDSGVTDQMLEAGGEEHGKWDNMLNEIYSELKQQLTAEEFCKLEEEELSWIKSRDEKSEVAANEFKGGSMEKVNKVMSLITSTKERCYELVKEYMK